MKIKCMVKDFSNCRYNGEPDQVFVEDADDDYSMVKLIVKGNTVM